MTSGQGHIFQEFDKALEQLRGDLAKMGRLTRQALDSAKMGLTERSKDVCNKVIADDEEIDSLELSIDELSMEILVRYRPVATDLRLVMSTMSVSRNLERIADHAVGIAKRSRKVIDAGEFSEIQLLDPIFDTAAGILYDAIQSYVDGDVQLAEALDVRDNGLDKLYKKATKVFTKKMEENQEGGVQSLLHLIFIIRSLERIGDLSVNIGEDAIFLQSAEDIRHAK